jgi:hypothetical protein
MDELLAIVAPLLSLRRPLRGRHTADSGAATVAFPEAIWSLRLGILGGAEPIPSSPGARVPRAPFNDAYAWMPRATDECTFWARRAALTETPSAGSALLLSALFCRRHPYVTFLWALLRISEIPHCRSPKFPRCRGRVGGLDVSLRCCQAITSWSTSSCVAMGASQAGQHPPTPIRRMKVEHGSHLCSPRARSPQLSHS